MRHLAISIWVTTAIFLAGAAQGSEPKPLGAFQDWETHTYQASDTKVCYVVSQPIKSEASKKKVKRDPIFFLITHMPGRKTNGEKIHGEVSTIIGYPFKESSKVKLTIDEAVFELFTNGDGAWVESTETESNIVAAMRAGRMMIVTGTSSSDTETIDTYSLSGFSAAMNVIDAACK